MKIDLQCKLYLQRELVYKRISLLTNVNTEWVDIHPGDYVWQLYHCGTYNVEITHNVTHFFAKQLDKTMIDKYTSSSWI